MFLAFWRADAIVFLVCLVFTSADTIVLTMIPIAFDCFWHSPTQIPLYLQSFLCTDTFVFTMISVFCAAIPAFLSTDMLFHNSSHCVHNDSRILERKYCYSLK